MTASIKGPLIKRLQSFTAVDSLASGRVYANRIPQGLQNLPCVVVTMDTKDRNQHLGGFDDSLVFDTLYLTAYASDSDTAEQLGASIAEQLESIEGETIANETETLSRQVAATMLIDEEDDCVPIAENSDRLIHYHRLEVQIQHSPPEPEPDPEPDEEP